MSQNYARCDLCALDVKIPGFTVNTQEGRKVFCCDGCKAAYSLLYAVNPLPNPELSIELTP